jgi:hypothetical protein
MDSKGFIQLVEKLISCEQKIGGCFVTYPTWSGRRRTV